MHGIMSSIAEFYSRTSRPRSSRGWRRRPRTAAHPGKVPFGYLNVRTRDEGRLRESALSPWTLTGGSCTLDLRDLRDGRLDDDPDPRRARRAEGDFVASPKRPRGQWQHRTYETILKKSLLSRLCKVRRRMAPGRHDALVTRRRLWEKRSRGPRQPRRGHAKATAPPHLRQGNDRTAGTAASCSAWKSSQIGQGNQYHTSIASPGETQNRTATSSSCPPHFTCGSRLIEDHWGARESRSTTRVGIATP